MITSYSVKVVTEQAVERAVEEVRLRLRDARMSRRLTRLMLARAAGLSPMGIYQIESGLRRPSVSSLLRLLIALGLSLDTITGVAIPNHPGEGI